jgi:hypothetical protein
MSRSPIDRCPTRNLDDIQLGRVPRDRLVGPADVREVTSQPPQPLFIRGGGGSTAGKSTITGLVQRVLLRHPK